MCRRKATFLGNHARNLISHYPLSCHCLSFRFLLSFHRCTHAATSTISCRSSLAAIVHLRRFRLPASAAVNRQHLSTGSDSQLITNDDPVCLLSLSLARLLIDNPAALSLSLQSPVSDFIPCRSPSPHLSSSLYLVSVCMCAAAGFLVPLHGLPHVLDERIMAFDWLLRGSWQFHHRCSREYMCLVYLWLCFLNEALCSDAFFRQSYAKTSPRSSPSFSHSRQGERNRSGSARPVAVMA